MGSGEWVDLNALLHQLKHTPVPDAGQPLMTSMLHADQTTSGSCLLVSFPVGWERGSGTYACFEHAVVLEGAIELDGDLWEAGTAFVVPADAQRRRTFAPSGAIAVAWFSGVPRWTGGGGVDEPASSFVWSGDDDNAVAAFDEVDVQGRRWRHVEPGQASSGAFLRYSWTH